MCLTFPPVSGLVFISLLQTKQIQTVGKTFSFSHMAFLSNWQPLNPDIFVFRPITNKTTLTTSCLHDIFNENFSPHHQDVP